MISRDRLSNILYPLGAKIDEGQRQLGPDVVPNNARDANCSRLRKGLQPGRDIDRIAKQVVALNHDVADMDADPVPHLLIRTSIRILFSDGVLHRDSRLHGIYGAAEIGDEAIARRVEDPTAMRCDQAIDDALTPRRSDVERNWSEPQPEGSIRYSVPGDQPSEA